MVERGKGTFIITGNGDDDDDGEGDDENKMGQNYSFSMPKSAPAYKKYTTDGCVVVTNMSFARSMYSNTPKAKAEMFVEVW